MPIYFSCFITALLSVSGDLDNLTLPQCGRLFILRVIDAMLRQQSPWRQTQEQVPNCQNSVCGYPRAEARLFLQEFGSSSRGSRPAISFILFCRNGRE